MIITPITAKILNIPTSKNSKLSAILAVEKLNIDNNFVIKFYPPI